MIGTTHCPHCNANFNISEAHLDTKLGLVRCGRCLEIFDFRVNYVANQTHPQLELPISDEYGHELDFTDDQIRKLLDEPHQEEIIGYSDFTELYEDDIQASDPAEEIEHLLAEDAHNIETLQPVEFEDIETLSPIEDSPLDSSHHANAIVLKPAAMEEQQEVEYEFAKKSYRVWPWAIAAGFSLLILLLQVTYLFRANLAANFPTTKPSLVSAC